VEPTKVADETSRWILVGNCLHKTGVFSGMASIASGLLSEEKNIVNLESCNQQVFLFILFQASFGPKTSASAPRSASCRCSAHRFTQSAGTLIHASNIK
jgi:Mitochondrial morphogenesis regulator